MRAQKTSSLFLLAMLLIASVRTQIPTLPENPYCPASNQINLEVTPMGGLQYDEYGYYWNSITDNSADLFLTFGDPEESQFFKFTIFDDVSGMSSSIECEDTDTMTFVALLQGALILKDEPNSKYYACLFDVDAIDGETLLPRAQLVLPPQISDPTNFVPFYFNDQQKFISVTVNNDAIGNAYTYTFPTDPIVTGTTTINAVAWSSTTITNIEEIEGVVGSGECLYLIGAQPKILCSGASWVDVTSDYGIISSNIVNFMPLANNHFGVAVLTEDGLSGQVLFSSGTTVPTAGQEITLTTQTERGYQFQSERISNIVIYSNEFLLWYNLDFAGNPRSVKLLNNDIDTGDTMIAMALSSNKLTVLYDGRVDYYGMYEGESDTAISHIFTKEFTGSDIEAEGAYRFGLACVCQTLKRFSCYSSTLNCLLIKKAQGVCGGRDIPEPGPA